VVLLTPWLLTPDSPEGGAHVDEGAVRDAVAGDEDGRLAADPERHDRAMGGVEAPKNLVEGSDGGRVAE